ncbi:matrixin family metalloprotease [Patescibacteria group bacterium]|nr:matrixin family metalloprotease [Patescibacteria group bacterium]MBU1868698.1 matrixin family metalloprotease [Patescibacteria group bacterium]
MLKKSRKLLIGINCLLFLALTFPTLAANQSRKPATTPPVLEKITFVHYAKGAKNTPPIGTEDFDRFKLLYGGIKWADTMTYQVNSAGSGLASGTVRDILEDSLETWDEQTSFELFDDTLGTTTEGFNSGDGINRITWGDLNSGIIAYNAFWFNRATKVIVESDVVFNTYYEWGDCLGNEEACSEDEVMDLQNIAIHEFGHNGLGDLYSAPSSALTMYGRSGFGETEKRTLGTGDINGIQALYGAP